MEAYFNTFFDDFRHERSFFCYYCPKVAQATTNKLKSISGGKNLSLTDMHGRGFRLKVM